MPFEFSIPAPRPVASLLNGNSAHGPIAPQGEPAPSQVTILLQEGESLLFVGANGSGKTRLAAYIENLFGERAHRISAHRALTLKPDVPKINEAAALRGLRFGFAKETGVLAHRKGQRWKDHEAVSLLNDFDFLVQALFAEQSRTALESHQRLRAGNQFDAKATRFERLQSIWQQLLPHRELVISGDDIQVREPEGELYSGADMSDGERAIFYLVGQALVAAENSLLVIDEPELHMHRSIMSKLWDHIENARPDCSFIFITHDLDFAASRVGQKFAINDYHASEPSWSLEEVPPSSGFSEELTTLLLGSRQPILFVEGELGSLDRAVYRCAYPNWTVVPRGSCKDVIHAVATMRANASLTRIHCAGIVDADDFDTSEVAAMRDAGVEVLPVSEVENLFLLPTISREIGVADHFESQEFESRMAALANELFSSVSQGDALEKALQRYCLRRIDRILKRADLSEADSVGAIASSYSSQVGGLDITAIAEERRGKIEAAISAQDLPTLLALLDDKGMLAKAASRLKNTTRALFEAWITRVLLNDRAPGLVTELRRSLPHIESA